MTSEVSHIQEPRLQFAKYFEHEDAKTGLSEFGPFGRNIPGLHPTSIKVGCVGTRATIDALLAWLEECGRHVESETRKRVPTGASGSSDLPLFRQEGGSEEETAVLDRAYKIVNRDFNGFSLDTEWGCEFQPNPRWQFALDPRDITKALDHPEKEQRILQLANLLDGAIQALAANAPAPNVIILALTREMEEKADTVRLSPVSSLNLRRIVKARSMRWGIPVQIMREGTVAGKRADIQEKATRAWNFCTAMYYKADGVPWRPIHEDEETCFVGVNFYMVKEGRKTTIRSSMAQAFDVLGQGFVVRGDPFEWDDQKDGRSPHLSTTGAENLIIECLRRYEQVRKVPPKRVVVHKQSVYWGEEHPGRDELSGFYAGIEKVFPRCQVDLVALNRSQVRVFREGKYPPIRGTHINFGDSVHLLYTMGYIPFLETYPGPYVPTPWQLVQHHGGSSVRQLFTDLLLLTKMNVNNCSYADSAPITLSFAKKLGEILKEAEGQEVQPHYKFYM